MVSNQELPPAAREAWQSRIATEMRAALESAPRGSPGPSPRDARGEPEPTELHCVEWPAFPARIAACTGRNEALRLLDWQADDGSPRGRLCHQEEYAEWRTVWQAGRLQAIEVTTELPEYWEALAGEDPARVLDLVAAFAGAASVPTASVFGEFDPFAATATPQQRAAAFRSQMFPSEDHRHPGPTSELNNGHAAITCMIHPDNNLSSLLRLVVSSCRPYLVRDSVTERPRFPSGSEAIIGIGANAVDGRNSDTLAVERLVRFATERRYIELADPIGIFICDVQHHELVQPDGSDVPVDWFKLSRGASSADGKPRYRRLRLEAPREAGLWLDELTIRRTEECLHYGGQLAELVQLALYVRTSASAGLADIDPADPSTSTPDCSSVLENWQEFRDSRDGLADR